MALVTISDTVHDPNGTLPTSGTVTFILSGWYKATDGHLVAPKSETATIVPSTGAFSIQLESTTDGNPATRKYSVQLTTLIEGINIDINLGDFQLDPTPATQSLLTLLLAGIVTPPAGTVFKFKEAPSGAINAANKIYTLAATPTVGSEHVFLNGNLQRLTTDYTLSGKTITMTVAPLVGDTVIVSYITS